MFDFQNELPGVPDHSPFVVGNRQPLGATQLFSAVADAASAVMGAGTSGVATAGVIELAEGLAFHQSAMVPYASPTALPAQPKGTETVPPHIVFEVSVWGSIG